MAPKTNFAFERDKSRARNAANSGHSATIGEISVRTRLRGGAGRTRTFNQTVMSEPRRLREKQYFSRPTKVTLPLTFDWTSGSRRACMRNRQDCRDLGVHAHEPGFVPGLRCWNRPFGRQRTGGPVKKAVRKRPQLLAR